MRYSASALRRKYIIQSISEVHKTSLLLFVSKQQHDLLPPVFQNYFYFRSANSRTTRQSNNLEIVFARTNFGSKSIKILGAEHWNDLPVHFKEIDNIEQFKRAIMNYEF